MAIQPNVNTILNVSEGAAPSCPLRSPSHSKSVQNEPKKNAKRGMIYLTLIVSLEEINSFISTSVSWPLKSEKAKGKCSAGPFGNQLKLWMFSLDWDRGLFEEPFDSGAVVSEVYEPPSLSGRKNYDNPLPGQDQNPLFFSYLITKSLNSFIIRPMLKVLFLLFSLSSFANTNAIYGEDNRIDVYATSNPLQLGMAQTTAAMIDKNHLKVQGGETLITGKTLGEMFKLCPTERFRNQVVAATCSGTLIAPDLIMTAGHCYEMAKQTCKENVWVFDFKISSENQTSVTVSNSKIYECDKVLLSEMNLNDRYDHALIKLKRPVTDRAFAKLSSSGEIRNGESIVLVGHPSGLPTKIAADGYVLSQTPTSFLSNLDAFTVNSGSGVFNAKTGEVEGILSSGRSDYDSFGNCTSVKQYNMADGNELVMKPIKIRNFLKTYK